MAVHWSIGNNGFKINPPFTTLKLAEAEPDELAGRERIPIDKINITLTITLTPVRLASVSTTICISFTRISTSVSKSKEPTPTNTHSPISSGYLNNELCLIANGFNL